MVITVFRARVRPNLGANVVAQLEEHGKHMYALASAMPGFISYKDFVAEDGEAVTIVEFDTQEHVLAWRDHPEHKLVQEWARQEVFSEYQIQVCELTRGSRFEHGTMRRF